MPLITTHAETGTPMAEHMPTAPQNFQNALANIVEFWTDNYDELSERFNTWLAQ